jgi:hypothetical protein
MISLPINPFLANQPVMGPQPPEDFAAAPAGMTVLPYLGAPPAKMLLPNSAGSPASMMLLPNTPVMGPQPPPGYQPPPRQILPNLSSILSAAPAAEPAPASEPTPQKSKWDQYVDLHRGGMDSFEAFKKVGMKKFGKNTWVDPETGRGLHINPSDLTYSDPGSIIEFFGWDRPEYRQEGLRDESYYLGEPTLVPDNADFENVKTQVCFTTRFENTIIFVSSDSEDYPIALYIGERAQKNPNCFYMNYWLPRRDSNGSKNYLYETEYWETFRDALANEGMDTYHAVIVRNTSAYNFTVNLSSIIPSTFNFELVEHSSAYEHYSAGLVFVEKTFI